jgi:hypothetical protein
MTASFRPRLTTTSLRFANRSPPSGWEVGKGTLTARTVERSRWKPGRPTFEASTRIGVWIARPGRGIDAEENPDRGRESEGEGDSLGRNVRLSGHRSVRS